MSRRTRRERKSKRIREQKFMDGSHKLLEELNELNNVFFSILEKIESEEVKSIVSKALAIAADTSYEELGNRHKEFQDQFFKTGQDFNLMKLLDIDVVSDNERLENSGMFDDIKSNKHRSDKSDKEYIDLPNSNYSSTSELPKEELFKQPSRTDLHSMMKTHTFEFLRDFDKYDLEKYESMEYLNSAIYLARTKINSDYNNEILKGILKASILKAIDKIVEDMNSRVDGMTGWLSKFDAIRLDNYKKMYSDISQL